MFNNPHIPAHMSINTFFQFLELMSDILQWENQVKTYFTSPSDLKLVFRLKYYPAIAPCKQAETIQLQQRLKCCEEQTCHRGRT